MKFFIQLLLMLSLSTSCLAKCGDRLESIFPNNSIIDLSGKIIIEGKFGFSTEAEIYLVSKNEKIRLSRMKTITGANKWAQVTYEAERCLTKGETYRLKMDRVLKPDRFKLYHWTAKDLSNIYNQLLIEDLNASSISAGLRCPVEIKTVFEISNKQIEDRYLTTEIIEIETGKIFTCYLRTYKNKFSIGGNQCSTLYRFTKGSTYKIRFLDEWYDNTSNWTNWTNCLNPI